MKANRKTAPSQEDCKAAISWFKSLENSKKVYLRTHMRLKDNIDIARYFLANVKEHA